MSKNVGSQTEETTDPQLKGTDGGREREREPERVQRARSQRDEAELKN